MFDSNLDNQKHLDTILQKLYLFGHEWTSLFLTTAFLVDKLLGFNDFSSQVYLLISNVNSNSEEHEVEEDSEKVLADTELQTKAHLKGIFTRTFPSNYLA
jgi:hypothetical protein